MKLHHLTEAQKSQRYERGRFATEYVRGDKVSKIITMDETWIIPDGCNSKGHVCHTEVLVARRA
ncbi:hypothetical protein RvY_00422 [Ramazzottius varieornatus]|uniref:Uncharacterized protein n=1 Tax=Ramazzottius varieornatus TaxID=947166 RepID=A0A1D1UK23_RAMVA|nr:hypothetical protein RvY_00422 [Ramazzottius varieornatus]